MGSCIHLLLSKRRDFIPSKYLVRSVITTVLPLPTFWITRSLRSIKFFNAKNSASDNFFYTLSKLYHFKVEKQISFNFFFRKSRFSDSISNIIVSLCNNSNCERKSAYSVFLGGIQNLSPLQSRLFSSAVKTYEEKLKITLLGSCKNLVRLAS